MTLSEFLNHFDFDYVIYKNKEGELNIGLIDLQEANLGGIEEERYTLDKYGVIAILDRLDRYYEDYIFDGLEESLEEIGVDTTDMTWKDIYEKIKELNLDWDMDVMPYIFRDKDLILNINDVDVLNEYLKEGCE